MIAAGFVMAVLGYWLLPDFLPECPARIDGLVGGVGVILVIVGVIFWILGAVGRPVGGRRYWY